MAEMPSGTVTFLFTDIEGSTRLLAALGDRYPALLDDHHRLLRSTFEAHDGYEVDNQGDGFFVAFASAQQAAQAAVEAQRTLAAHTWPDGVRPSVRMGLHTGEADTLDKTYVGMDVHRAARIAAAAHGGQIVLSDDTRTLIDAALPPAAALADLGHHRLKDLPAAEHLHQLTVEGLPAEFPPLRSLSGPGKLPSMPTGFVGRAGELAALQRALDQEDLRLLTLTGPGGSGKTRLALEVAARNQRRFEGGTYFVPLAPVHEAESAAWAIAEALGVREAGNRETLDLLTDHLRERHALLVLDDVEQVRDAGPLLAGLLAAAPRLRLLVTSRAALHVYGEHEMPVRPMALPEPGADTTDIADADAVHLFVQRARAVAPGFELNPDNAPAVADIVARIDGLPLAIELAASRVRLLSPQELAGRLGSRLRLLTGGASDLPDRQRTLRATIDWSYRLLELAEQGLFRRLSCFVGGCTLEAAAAVAEGPGEQSVDVLDGLASLLDKSLLWREERRTGTTRFRMLETLREYAREQLDAHDEAGEVSQRHARHYLAWAEQARERLDAGDTSLLEQFDEEHGNVLAALDWAAATDDPDSTEITLRLVTAMGWYWYTRGHTQVAAPWLERALQQGSTAPAQLRAKPLYWLGAILDRRGDLAPARAAMEASVAAWREVGDLGKLATALNGLGSVAENQGDLASAKAAYTESLAGYREVGDDHGIATVLSGLGTLALTQGDLAQAERHLGEGLRLFTASQDRWSIAVIESQLAWTTLELGRPEEAAILAHDATGRFREWGEQSYLAACLELHAALAAGTRPHGTARLLGAAHALREQVGASLPQRERRDLERHVAPARQHLGEAFDEAFDLGRRVPLDTVLEAVLLEHGMGTRAGTES
jgi:predicted ATPase/class 3 adenylate cyclase